MIRRGLAALLVLLFVMAGAMLASPVLAVTVHATTASATLLAEDGHGHVHDGDLSDIHDALDHAHDAPTFASMDGDWELKAMPVINALEHTVSWRGAQYCAERPPRIQL